MDPSKINNHFGNTPIYGLVHNFNEGIKVMKMMANDSEMTKKWIPLTTEDMLNNAKIWKMNQSMKNDNDSMAENMSVMDSSMMKGNAIQAVQ
jgi:predicted carbohydrate-binding protein with CBM5 and CBM33 domain